MFIFQIQMINMIDVDTSEELSIAGWIFTPIFLLREKTRSKKDPGNELLDTHTIRLPLSPRQHQPVVVILVTEVTFLG